MNSKREGAAALKVPERFARLCEALVNSAYGYGPPPVEGKELESFRSWVIYEGGAEADLWLDSFIEISGLQFTDDDVRDDLEMDEDGEINDVQRLAYARAFIDGYDYGSHDPPFAIVAKIKRRSGKAAYYCALGGSGGHGVVWGNWYGCYRDPQQFFDQLRADGYWHLGDDTKDLSDEKIMAQWYFPAPRKGDAA
jgi:hypothetical protein